MNRRGQSIMKNIEDEEEKKKETLFLFVGLLS